MDFVRQTASTWREDVPGARWFKADLHIHTIDDHPGRRARMPEGITGPKDSSETLNAYARQFLHSAIERGVQVLGLTPHRPRIDDSGEQSATWRIVEEWNEGSGDNGKPFREQIYAVFPGFEPSLYHGKNGLHLIFLFDPEIGQKRYLGLFDLIMDGQKPWLNNELAMTHKRHDEVFELLHRNREQDLNNPQSASWDYFVLAPHIDRDKGIFETLKSQVLQKFPKNKLAGLELADGKLPEDTTNNRQWLEQAMQKNRQAFFHSSDAYRVEEIGQRYVWLKLASPNIEAMRQAFAASETRLRIAYERSDNNTLRELTETPDATFAGRNWLKSVTVKGPDSFFGVGDGKVPTKFEFSPDITCVIGGSMTGKSTLLDGLRTHIGAQMPADERLKSGVQDRAKKRFLHGLPDIELDCPGQDPTAPDFERFPAEFYTQRELSELAQDPDTIENILVRLDVPIANTINTGKANLDELDAELNRVASELDRLDKSLADSEQAVERSVQATSELKAFKDAGVNELNRALSDTNSWKSFVNDVDEVIKSTKEIITSVESITLPTTHVTQTTEAESDTQTLEQEIVAKLAQVQEAAKVLQSELCDTHEVAKTIHDKQERAHNDLQMQVNRKLASGGLDGDKINELQSLNSHASLLDSYKANLGNITQEQSDTKKLLTQYLDNRAQLVEQQREAFENIIGIIHDQFNGHIRVRRINNGHVDSLEKFILDFRQQGITRWWNKPEKDRHPSPEELLKKLNNDQLNEIGMSPTVQEAFKNCMIPTKQRELAALRCPDLYMLELRIDGGEYRPLDKLSGGQRVNLLLSLLLEATDNRPLVIDQPEDDLDKRYLFDELLPALWRLKGKRQVIFATHDANIVVNGDADQVIQLIADSNHGYIATSGAIEDSAVRDAIVQTVDGGSEAFLRRQLKYGF